ncbi:MAG: hypothetical protein WCX96_01380 [Bacilli bacterium]
MKNKNLIRGIIMLVIGIIWLGLAIYFYIAKDTTREKLEGISFVLKDDYYIRKVIQDETTYEEIVHPIDNEFIRMTNIEGEKEVYSYNYEKDTFTYLYYFEDELIMKLIYGYESNKVIEDKNNLYEDLEEDIAALRTYFEDLLEENKIEKDEL